MPNFRSIPVFECFIPGIPFGQPRAKARAIIINGKPSARVYDPGTAEGWKEDIARTVCHHMPPAPLDGALRVDVTYFLPRPQKYMRKKDPEGPMLHVVKPDVDNLDKATFDALTRIGALRDDCIICGGERGKYYVGKEGRTGARLRVSRLVLETDVNETVAVCAATS